MLAPLQRRSRLLLMAQRRPGYEFFVPNGMSDGYAQSNNWTDPLPSGGAVWGSAWHYNGYIQAGYCMRTGFRFYPVNIPAGVVLTKGVVRLRSQYTRSGAGCHLRIRGEPADNGPNFQAVPQGIWTRERGTAEISDWDPGPWIVDVWYETPDLKAVVQEIINRPGWLPGNSIVIWIDGQPGTNNYRRVWEYDGSSKPCAPKLVLWY